MAYQFTSREYVMMVRAYFISGENVSAALRMYRELYPNARQPNYRTMLTAYQRLLDHGSFYVPSHAQGRGRPALSQNLYDDVVAYFVEDPRRSTNDAARRFGISQFSAWKIINSAGMHPYHYRKVQELTTIDRAPRITFCHWVLSNQNVNVLFSDECLFTRVGLFNQHNEHWWSYRNPKLTREHSFQHRFSLNVWAGILNDEIIGPYFIEGRLTGETYLNLLRTMVSNMLDDIPLSNLRGLWFQQDGAPPHYHRDVREYLTQEFGECWIGRGGPVPWPARSPDLTPLDFFLWSEIKRRVYVDEPGTIEVLKQRIIAAFNEVKQQRIVLMSLKGNLIKRARVCIDNEGGHFEQLLKYL